MQVLDQHCHDCHRTWRCQSGVVGTTQFNTAVEACGFCGSKNLTLSLAQAISEGNGFNILVPRQKYRATYLTGPEWYHLNNAVHIIELGFPDNWGVYLVGSVLAHKNFRDVDLRMILPDAEFDRLFPKAMVEGELHVQRDPFWNVLVSALNDQLVEATGLPIDFQIQRATQANEIKGARNAIGLDLNRYPGGG